MSVGQGVTATQETKGAEQLITRVISFYDKNGNMISEVKNVHGVTMPSDSWLEDKRDGGDVWFYRIPDQANSISIFEEDEGVFEESFD